MLTIDSSLIGNEVARVAPRVLINDKMFVSIVSDAVISLSLAPIFKRRQFVIGGVHAYAVTHKNKRQKHLFFILTLRNIIRVIIRVGGMFGKVYSFAIHSRF